MFSANVFVDGALLVMNNSDLSVFVLFFLYQVRLESIEAINKILEEANKRIQPTGTGMIMLSTVSFNNWDHLLLL